MKKNKARKLVIIAVGIGLFSATFYYLRLNLIAYYAFLPETDFTEFTIKPGFEEIWIEGDGVKRHALFSPAKTEAKKKVILYLHGNSGNVFGRQDIAQHLNEIGYDVLLLEYSGYGKSEGRATEPAIYGDAQQALDYLTDERGYTNKQVVVMGRSIGSTAAVDVAQGQDIAAVILVSPLYSGFEIAKLMNMGILQWGAITSFDNARKVKNISVPVMIIHGEKDEITPLNFGEDLFRELTGNRNLFMLITGAKHNGLFEHAGKSIWEEIDAFIQRSSGVNKSEN